MKAFTEEEIRSKIVIPLLKDIGLSYNDLHLETSFTIQLGRGVYNIKNESKKQIGGRLDILCKLDNRNLFILELKAESVKIDKTNDSLQGLSYARLMQPMPPYVILTNGKETYLFDTISGKEIDKSYILRNGYHVSIEDDILFRFNAMKNFIGYSFKNLLIFCKTISAEHFSKFSAPDDSNIKDKLSKKYTPLLYVERSGLKKDFNSFLTQTEKNVFAIVGPSGCGKTNSILNLFNKQKDNPALFYSGTLLGSSFFEELQFDFNLEFSQQETELSIIKKISLLAEQHSKQFIFFIDAIDEWIAIDKSNQLDKIIKIASRYNIKLCISCKDLLWSSLLTNKAIPTNLSEQLYKVYLINDFNENEFNKALTNYSNTLKVATSSSPYSRDMYNPFSLRIAFEVSHANKNTLINDNSSDSISLYLNQKLVNSSNSELCKRYLFAIAELLLKNNKIQEDEITIRSFLKLNIADDLPKDLFSNSLLYCNNIDNQNFIGFYYSKIRDYIISYELLQLNKKQQKDRINEIIKSLNFYIGENAVNFYIGSCDSIYLTDCIDSIITFDQTNKSNLTIKLFAQQNQTLYSKINDKQFELLFSRINELIKSNSLDYLNHEEINIVLKKISKVFNIEPYLIEMLYLINEFSPDYNTHDICKLLEKYNSEEGTNKLVEFVQDKNIETNIRRFTLDSLNKRNITCKKQILLSLMDEYLDFGSGPLFYAKSWYRYVEDLNLRDLILSKFDSKPNTILAKIFAYSKIKNTAELLFSRFLKNKYSKETTWWLCRTICTLKYKPSIQKFIEIIKENRDSELSGHLLIGLGEMQAKELKPLLYDIIKFLPDNYKNITWLRHAFTGIMDNQDYLNLLEIANKSKNIPTIEFTASTLSNKKNTVFNEFILNFVSNKGIDTNIRYRVFQEWSNNLALDESKNGMKIVKNIGPSDKILTRTELIQVHKIIKEDNDLSTIGLLTLMNFENNIEELKNSIISSLPTLEYPIHINSLILINISNLKELKVSLNYWLKENLGLSSWKNKNFLFNCIQLAGLFGDLGHAEIIENNKTYIYNNFQIESDDEQINKEKYIEHILHLIRVSDNNVRTRLD